MVCLVCLMVYVLGALGGVSVGVPGVLVGGTGVLDCGFRGHHVVPDVLHAVLGLLGGVPVAVTDVLRGVFRICHGALVMP